MESLDIYFKVRYLLTQWNNEYAEYPYDKLDFFIKDHKEPEEFRLMINTMGGAIRIDFIDFRVESRNEMYHYVDPKYNHEPLESDEFSITTRRIKTSVAMLEFHNIPAVSEFKAQKTEYKVPRKFKASRFHTSGGGIIFLSSSNAF